jgi:hypothetical protein
MNYVSWWRRIYSNKEQPLFPSLRALQKKRGSPLFYFFQPQKHLGWAFFSWKKKGITCVILFAIFLLAERTYCFVRVKHNYTNYNILVSFHEPSNSTENNILLAVDESFMQNECRLTSILSLKLCNCISFVFAIYLKSFWKRNYDLSLALLILCTC